MTELMVRDERSISVVAGNRFRGYRSPVTVNPVTGFGDPISKRRIGAPITIAGAFFVPAHPVYGGCAWETFGSAGFLLPRFANLRTAATHSFGDDQWQLLLSKRGSTMTNFIPSRIRALAHRRMALAALRADSSLKNRLARYSNHMEKARALETQGGAQ